MNSTLTGATDYFAASGEGPEYPGAADWHTHLDLCALPVFAAPVLGVLSDRYGRRPLLLICLLGSTLGYLLFGLGGALWVFILSRVIDGLTGGNDSILTASIGDLSEKHTRRRLWAPRCSIRRGLSPRPVIGGFTATLGYQVPFFIAAGLALLNLLWGCFLSWKTPSIFSLRDFLDNSKKGMQKRRGVISAPDDVELRHRRRLHKVEIDDILACETFGTCCYQAHA